MPPKRQRSCDATLDRLAAAQRESVLPMASVASLNWGRLVLRAIAAGIVGGIFIDLFIYLTTIMPQHGSMISLWQFIASTAFGSAAFASQSYAWIGLAIHFAVSIAWAAGYTYLASTQPGVNARPVVSGLVFGFVVWCIMQLALYTVQELHITSATQVVLSIIAHMLFFGLPVALVVHAQLRSQTQ